MILNNNTKRPPTESIGTKNVGLKFEKGLDVLKNKNKLVPTREFGREISTLSITNNMNKPRNKSNKGDIKKIFKPEVPLYNLRPRVNQDNNSFSLGHNKQGSFNSSFNNENNNAINIDNSSDVMEVDMTPNVMQVTYRGNKIPSYTNKNKINLIFPNKKNISLFNQIESNKDKCTPNVPIVRNPQICHEYLYDIYNHIKATEVNFQPNSGYMQRQNDINDKMRAILIDWIVDVHLKFKLLPETLFLTVNLIDRFLEKNVINRSRLQLVGVASLFIACKYEEIYPPELKDFVYVTDKAYSRNDILMMENDILNCLGFNVTTPSSFRFLELYFEMLEIKNEEKLFFFSRYILELVLCEYKMLKYPSSLLSATALYIANRILKATITNRLDLFPLTGYSDEKLKECGKDVCILIEAADTSQLQAIRTKFTSEKFLGVANWSN